MKKILLRGLLAFGVFILIIVINLVITNITASKISQGNPIEASGSDHTALLIIDIQEGTTGTASATKSYQDQAEELIGHVNRIAEEGAEKDWSVIYIRSEVVNPLINLINNTMARGSEGAKLDKRLYIQSEHIVTKRRNDPFIKTPLDQILVENNTGRVVVVGLDAAHCVNSAVQAALNRNYKVAVISKAVIAQNEADKTRMMEQFRDMGVEIVE